MCSHLDKRRSSFPDVYYIWFCCNIRIALHCKCRALACFSIKHSNYWYMYIALFQIREGSQVTNLPRLATWPDKLMANFWWFCEVHIYWPVAIPHWHICLFKLIWNPASLYVSLNLWVNINILLHYEAVIHTFPIILLRRISLLVEIRSVFS